MRTAERRTKKVTRPARLRGGMAVRIAGRLEIPEWVRDYESFRRWARSPECPEKARLAFYDGDLWVDPDMEQFYAHNDVKAEFTAVLRPLVNAGKLGRYGTDGMLVSHSAVGLATTPDGFFFTFEALTADRIRPVSGARNGVVEFEGTPDMVLEVVSDSSEEKDLVDLPTLYWKGGIAEYWVVDARGEYVRFEILKRGPKAYNSTRKQTGGWVRSDVFGRSFRLVRGQDPVGKPVFTLEVK
ncbi:MAG TPA: Uma2 family endonuclease [Gemmataceae bacterium]|nr:Uma2 family endonuclease [Gemmataceae bacterium]